MDSLPKTVPVKLPGKLLAPRFWPTWLGVAAFWAITQLPRPLRQRLGKLAGTIVWRRNKKRRDIVDVNLAMCFPEWSKLERDAINKRHFQVMGRTLLDIGIIWFASDRRLLKFIDLEGWEHIAAVRNSGQNIILNVAHSAGLDFGAMAVGSRIAGIAPYKAARNEVVDWWVARARRRFGNKILERGDGMIAYTRALRKGVLLYVLTDEDYGKDASVFVPFFGQAKASLPMVGRLAKIGNARVLPAMTYYCQTRHRYVTRVFPALEDFPVGDNHKDTARLNQSLEQMIRLSPEEYMWTLRIFLTRPDGSRVYRY